MTLWLTAVLMAAAVALAAVDMWRHGERFLAWAVCLAALAALSIAVIEGFLPS